MIIDRVNTESQKGFAIGLMEMKYIPSQITADGRKGLKNGSPSDAAIRSFRAQNIELTFRRAKPKDAAKNSSEKL